MNPSRSPAIYDWVSFNSSKKDFPSFHDSTDMPGDKLVACFIFLNSTNSAAIHYRCDCFFMSQEQSGFHHDSPLPDLLFCEFREGGCEISCFLHCLYYCLLYLDAMGVKLLPYLACCYPLFAKVIGFCFSSLIAVVTSFLGLWLQHYFSMSSKSLYSFRCPAFRFQNDFYWNP
jgi:hypothetical protein